MRIGFYTLLYNDKPLDEVLDAVKELGAEAVEIPTGGFVGTSHCDPAALLEDKGKLEAFTRAVDRRGLFISALSCHANVLHPDKDIGGRHSRDLYDTVRLAERIGVRTVVGFAGCPAGSKSDTCPNWITAGWPDYFVEALKWQWEECIIPYWRKAAEFAQKHGQVRIALEMHPGDSVYNPEKLLHLRNQVGDTIGCNFDPSHLFWQGIDPLRAVNELGSAIYHVHAKDCRVDTRIASLNGVLEARPYNDPRRSWIYRTVGYGHDYGFWKDLMSALRAVGYDYVLSMEHEDILMSRNEGMRKAFSFLRDIVLTEPKDKMWWD